ncbi:MAG TPA: hypothetical protein VHW69_16000 [Rhizomicrobium sp.]|jgi:hypothetical protein|nr:hypothetical protein [Rhizomicrobium sp.]
MNKLTQTLLTGSALGALMAAPVMAQPAHPAMHVMALHAGHAVNKTKFHIPSKQYLTYTYAVYSSASASSVDQDIYYTYWRWNSITTGCPTFGLPKQKVKTPKRTIYGSTKADTETYSFGCPTPLDFHGDAWTNKTGVPGDVDKFQSSLISHFKFQGQKYKGTLYFDVSLTITQ